MSSSSDKDRKISVFLLDDHEVQVFAREPGEHAIQPDRQVAPVERDHPPDRRDMNDIYARAADKLASLFAEKGIQTLRNDAVTLQVGGSKVSMLGIDDLRTGRPDLSRALKTADRNPGEVKIMLSHRPEIFPKAAKGGVELARVWPPGGTIR